MKQIETLHLFPNLTNELLTLLRSLDSEDWLKPSPIKNRTVKDLVSHLIDGSLRRLSLQRDRYSSRGMKVSPDTYDDLVNYIQKLNRDWMDVSDRLSPRILIDLLEYSENELHNFFKTLNPNEKAIFSVAWAGESESENWFDIAREYTEKWHHQMQIRLALNKPILLDKTYTEPLYDTFMLGLPFLFKDEKGFEVGENIKISIKGTLNKSWVLEKKQQNWAFIDNRPSKINTSVELPDDIAWIIFTNTDRNKEKYRTKIKTKGDDNVELKLLHFVTVMS